MIYAIKILLSVALILASAEVAKRYPALAAMIIALPLTSMIAMSFLYYDTRDAAKVASMARSIPPVVVPSLLFFYAFSFLVDKNLGFVMAMLLATLMMLSCYGLYMYFFARNGM